MLVKIAPEFGYKFLAAGCANRNDSAFAERMSFTSFKNGRHWVARISDISRALNLNCCTPPEWAPRLLFLPSKQARFEETRRLLISNSEDGTTVARRLFDLVFSPQSNHTNFIWSLNGNLACREKQS